MAGPRRLTDEATEFGTRLGLALQRLGVSPAELTRRLGMGHSYLTDLLKGRQDPRLSTCRKIAQALGIPQEELLADSPARLQHVLDVWQQKETLTTRLLALHQEATPLLTALQALQPGPYAAVRLQAQEARRTAQELKRTSQRLRAQSQMRRGEVCPEETYVALWDTGCLALEAEQPAGHEAASVTLPPSDDWSARARGALCSGSPRRES